MNMKRKFEDDYTDSISNKRIKTFISNEINEIIQKNKRSRDDNEIYQSNKRQCIVNNSEYPQFMKK